jgi:hypothetical protein
MSNQSCLFAEDIPTPFNPFIEGEAPGANTRIICCATCQVPAYWLFCFEPSNLTHVESEEGRVPELVSEMGLARSRLAARDGLARELFPDHDATWKEFRAAIEAADRHYLKMDAYEIWMMHEDDGTFGKRLASALRWFDSKRKGDLDSLFWLAEIEGYDRRTKAFKVDDDNDPERYLIGWFEDE